MIILGISPIGHDTAATITVDGDIVAACEQERYSKDKHSSLFPIDAIHDCLKIANLSINQIDMIAVSWDHIYMLNEYYLKLAIKNKSRLDFLIKDIDRVKELFNLEDVIKKKLKFQGSIKFFKHHLCHLASSYYSSGFTNALLVSYDGCGEIDTMSIGSGDNGNISLLELPNKYPNSLGLLYAAVTDYLGWKYSCDEGIVMGLATLGNPDKVIPKKEDTYYEYFYKNIIQKENFQIELNMPNFMNFYEKRNVWVGDDFIKILGPKRNKDDPLEERHKNIAAGLQKCIEQIIINQLRNAKNKYGYNKLCISGGVGLNCTLNGKIHDLNIFEEIFIVPPSGDQGTSVGAAFLGELNLTKNIKVKKRHNFYLGSRFDDSQIHKEIKNYDVNFILSKNLESDIAQHIFAGKIIGWFQGGAEFGPRALGNRSILTKPFPNTMKDYLNSRVKFREEFRPFAPAILENHANDYFKINQSSPHMLIAVQAKKNKKDQISATVHNDNSSRVQTVSKEMNERFYNLINEFYKISKVPVLLNTSFNVKGQPIVNTPKEAIETFLKTNIDVLAIGNYILTK